MSGTALTGYLTSHPRQLQGDDRTEVRGDQMLVHWTMKRPDRYTRHSSGVLYQLSYMPTMEDMTGLEPATTPAN